MTMQKKLDYRIGPVSHAMAHFEMTLARAWKKKIKFLFEQMKDKKVLQNFDMKIWPFLLFLILHRILVKVSHQK